MLSLKFLYNNPLGSLLTSFKEKIDQHGSHSSEVVPADKDQSLKGDPLRAEYVTSIPRAQWYRGVLLQGYMVPANILRGMEEFEIRSDDIFIVTYPKSGTTWTEEIVSLVVNNGDLSKVKDKLLCYRVEHLEVGRPIGHLRHLRKLKSPRLMATHLPLPLIPRQLRQAKCKIIYVVRNPKDNAVSYYHHHRMSTYLGNFKGTWEEFLAHYLKGHVVYGSWFDHVLPYWIFSQENPDKVLFLSFEELKMDLPGMVARIGNFLNHSLSPEAINTIANHCSFEQMKNNLMVNREVLPLTDLFDMTKSKFMRKGIIGDWKNHFSSEQSSVFDQLYRTRMEGSGLDLAFEPEEALRRMSQYGRIILNANNNACAETERVLQRENCNGKETLECSVFKENGSCRISNTPRLNSTLTGETNDHGRKIRQPKSIRRDKSTPEIQYRSSYVSLPSFQPYATPDPIAFDVVF